MQERKIHGAKRVPFFPIRPGWPRPVSEVSEGSPEETDGVWLGVNASEREQSIPDKRKSVAVQNTGVTETRAECGTGKEGKPGGWEVGRAEDFVFLLDAFGNPSILYQEVARSGCIWKALISQMEKELWGQEGDPRKAITVVQAEVPPWLGRQKCGWTSSQFLKIDSGGSCRSVVKKHSLRTWTPAWWVHLQGPTDAGRVDLGPESTSLLT